MRYGAQDLSVHDSGVYTGEISGAFLSALECRYVLVGHSERRTLHAETDEVVGAKVRAALKHGIVPVLCVGETADDLEAHGPSAVPVAQFGPPFEGISADPKTPGSPEIVVAYEPVWAMAQGLQQPQSRRSRSVQHSVALRETAGDEIADATRILYGGSVKSSNIASFLRESDVDGALVGGASLDATEFAAIARFQKHVGV